MLELDELDDLDVVPDRTEELRARGVRHLRGESLPEGAEPQQRPKRRVLELRHQLVLAARHGEDDGNLGPHGTIEHVVRGRVAGVEADDEIGAGQRLVAGDVPDLEAQALGTDAPRELLTVVDDVGLQVEPDDLDLTPVDVREEVVERERQVRPPGPEVDDSKSALGEVPEERPPRARESG